MINVNKVLDEAIEKDASDIHFIIENKPMLRISRELIPSENADVLTEEDMNEIKILGRKMSEIDKDLLQFYIKILNKG